MFALHHFLLAMKGVVHFFMEGDVLKEKIVKTWGVPMIMFLLAGTNATRLTLFHNQIRPVILNSTYFFIGWQCGMWLRLKCVLVVLDVFIHINTDVTFTLTKYKSIDFFLARHLTCHSRKSTDLSNKSSKIKNLHSLFKCPSKLNQSASVLTVLCNWDTSTECTHY